MSDETGNKTADPEELRQAAELEHLIGEASEQASGGEWEPGPDQFSGRAAAEQQKTADVLAPLLMITFSLVAARKGKHWALSLTEANEAAEAYAEVLDKYAPEVALGPELTALLVTAMIVAPRVGQDKANEAKRAAEERKRGDHGDTSE